jgi:hypothetical protein
MRVIPLVVFLSVAVLLPKVGSAQAYMLPTSPPDVSAANASWQINGEPVFYEGDFYYPSAPTVYFDGNVMRRSGMYRGIPLYVDATLQPGSMVYVPIGGRVLRPYERKRYGELAGTTGSRTPWYPIQRDVELSASSGAIGIQTPALASIEQPVVPEAGGAQASAGPMVGTFNASGTFMTSTGGSAGPVAGAPAPDISERRRVESIPPPQTNAGVWIEFNGARWFAGGSSQLFFEERFVQIGDYHGFPVYRVKNGPSNEIWIPIFAGGSLASYRR